MGGKPEGEKNTHREMLKIKHKRERKKQPSAYHPIFQAFDSIYVAWSGGVVLFEFCLSLHAAVVREDG